ncbi:MAG: radical SAM protein [Anaerolineaceae bacterium]|nr:MAG: radical SAM protein [Anaerolineaceae bacterium]
MILTKKFIECTVPVTACNLKCEYCYVIQENRRTNNIEELPYSIEFIAKALSPDRLGGVSYINLCGAGETLLPHYIIDLIEKLLVTGNFVNVTTNGTLSNRFDELIALDHELLSRLHIAFSFHYDELTRTKNLKSFFRNVDIVNKNSISLVVQCNLCDSYIERIDEIKSICVENIGGLPQFVVTRKEGEIPFTIYTENEKEYFTMGKHTESNLFDFTYDSFNKKRCHYCYAGAWSYKLILKTGELKRCYAEPVFYNIYNDISERIPEYPIGYNCKSDYCVNASHFLTLGTMPDIVIPSYDKLRNRKELLWYSKKMIDFFKQRLFEDNTITHERANNIAIIEYEDDYVELLDKKIIIYGAGNYGGIINKKLLDNGIKPVLICDSDPKKQDNQIVSVEKMKSSLDEYDNPLIVVAIKDDKIVNEVIYTLKDLNAELCTYYTVETALRHINKARGKNYGI